MVQIYKFGQHNQTLEIQGGKLGVKLDNSGNVKFSATDSGLKGQVEIPVQKKAVKGIKVEGNQLVLTNTEDGSEERVDLPAVPVDVKLQGAELQENKLVLTLTDQSKIEVDLAKFVDVFEVTAEAIKTALAGADTGIKQAIVAALLPELKAALKGEEVKDLSDQSLGFLLQA